MNSHVDKQNGTAGLAADFSYLDENELAAVTTFAAHIKLRSIHPSFFRQIADALEGRDSVFKPAEPLKADASEIEGAAAWAQRQTEELKAAMKPAPEGDDPDDDILPLCELKMEVQGASCVRSLKGLTKGQFEAVFCFASALASDLLDVSALKFLAGIVEGSRDD